MKSLNERREDLTKDEALVEKLNAALSERTQEEPYQAFVEVAGELGYDVKKEEVEELVAANQEELSEEELGKVAGGTSITIAISVVSLATLSSAIVKMSWDETH